MSAPNQSVLGVLSDLDFQSACEHLPWFPWRGSTYDEYVAYIESTRDRLREEGLLPIIAWMFVDELIAWCEAEDRTLDDETTWSAHLYHLIETDPERLVPFADGVREHLLRDRALATFEELSAPLPGLEAASYQVYGEKAHAFLEEISHQANGRYVMDAYALGPVTEVPVESFINGQVAFQIDDGLCFFASDVQNEAALALLACVYAAPGGAILLHRRNEYDDIERRSFVVEAGRHREAEPPSF